MFRIHVLPTPSGRRSNESLDAESIRKNEWVEYKDGLQGIWPIKTSNREDSGQKEFEKCNVEETNLLKCLGTLGVNLHLVKSYRSLD